MYVIYLVLLGIKIIEREIMANQSINQFKKGILPMLILQIISDEKDYGYNIVNRFNARCVAGMDIKEGTLYPILHRLEEDGAIASEWVMTSENGKPKKFYKITEEGKLLLEEQWNCWTQIEGMVRGFEKKHISD